jgi:hypothetical protein
MSGSKKYCVVTPYFREDVDMLRRCMDSVRRQTVRADHILVADGFPQAWIDSEPVRHLKLDRPHADYGNFARGVGALAAVAEGYDAVCFLDADNWYDDDHIATCLAAAEAMPRAGYVAARRRFVRPDASVITGVPEDYPDFEHIDTNCLFLPPAVYPYIHRWCTMPRELSASGDHLFFLGLHVEGLVAAPAAHPTVNYLCLVEQIYLGRGETPPPNAKPVLNWAERQAWLNGLSPEALAHVSALAGLRLPQIPVMEPAE